MIAVTPHEFDGKSPYAGKGSHWHHIGTNDFVSTQRHTGRPLKILGPNITLPSYPRQDGTSSLASITSTRVPMICNLSD